jgi:hypothetical protein
MLNTENRMNRLPMNRVRNSRLRRHDRRRPQFGGALVFQAQQAVDEKEYGLLKYSYP